MKNFFPPRLISALLSVSLILSFPLWSKLFIQLSLSLPSTQDVVGYCSFNGYVKQLDLLPFYFVVLCVFILFAWAGLKDRATGVFPAPPLSSLTISRSHTCLFVICSLVLLLFALPPFYHYSLLTQPMTSPQFSWDELNIVTWDYQFIHGFLPYRDFWYPYGGEIFEKMYSVSGNLVFWFHHFMVLFGIYYFAVRFSRSYFIGTALIVLYIAKFNDGVVHRYGLALLPICASLIAFETPRSIVWPILCGVSLGFVGFYELNLAAGPIAGLFLISILKAFEGSQKSYFKQLLIIFLSFVASFGIWIASLIHNGQWEGFVNFYSLAEFKAMAIYGYNPAPLWEMFQPGLNLNFGVFALFMIMLGALIYLLVKNRFKLTPATTFLIPAVITSLGIIMKCRVRPGMSHQIITFVAAAFLYLCCFTILPKLKTKWVEIGALALAVYLLFNATVFKEEVSRNLNMVKWTLSDPKTFSRFEQVRKNHFKIELSALSQEQNDLIRDLKQENSEPVLALGDENWIYFGLGQENLPPYLTHYNASRILAQNQIIRWIETNHVNTAIWNRDRLTFDSVPNLVRSPILYEYLTNHFTLEKQIGIYSIFKRSTDSSEKKFASWLKFLGNTIDLGTIPFATNLAKKADCTSGEGDCIPILAIQSKNREPPLLEVAISYGLHPFKLKIKNFNDREAYVRLDRLWFWSLLKSNLISFEVPNATARLIWKKMSADQLY